MVHGAGCWFAAVRVRGWGPSRASSPALFVPFPISSALSEKETRAREKKYSASDAAVLCTYAPMGVRFSMGTPSPSLPPAEAGGSDDSQCLPAPPPVLTRASPLSVAARSRSGVPVTKPQMSSTRNPGCRLLLRLDVDSLCVFPSSCAPPSPPPSPPARPKLHPLLALAKRGMNGDRVRKVGFR